MTDDALRDVWRSDQSARKESLMTTIDAVLDEDRAARDKDRWVRMASMIALSLLCPATLWCAAYGKTPLVRGAYALMGAGTAIAVFAEWLYQSWSRQALPGPADTRSQLQTTALQLARQANLFRTGPLWSAPVFVGVAMIGLWMYQERSHAGGDALWAVTVAGWLVSWVGGVAKARTIDARRSRMERMLADLRE